ncbi:hypothetical protein CJ195_27270 [Bacillus sp. UMB0899]|nr:hypothetical protein CJ195_27270 [Bacillus sp. UMB0899]
MKKRLLLLLFSSALVLGACSGEETGGTKVDKEEPTQEVVEKKHDENVLAFEVDSEKVEVELTEADVQPQLAKKYIYLKVLKLNK